MLKKYMLALLIIILAFTTSFTLFAEEVSNEEYVYIINPEVGNSGKAILNDTMFISIYVQSERDLVLELIKKPVFTFEESITTEPVVEVVSDFVEEKITLFDMLTKPEVISKDDIARAYYNAQMDLDMTESTYRSAISATDHLLTIDEAYELTDEDALNVEHAADVAIIYNQALLNRNYWKNIYLKLFEETIVDDLLMSVDASFPYFEYTVNDIVPGHYKLSVKTEEGITIESLELEVVSEENIADEILEGINFYNLIDAEVFE